MPEAEHRSKCERAVLAPAEAAAYQQACAGIVEPYKNVVRFDGAPLRPALQTACDRSAPMRASMLGRTLVAVATSCAAPALPSASAAP